MKLLAALATLLFLAGSAIAEGCPTTQDPTLTLPTPVGTYYVQNDACQPECLFSIWVYEESNGKEGLQRGDETCVDDGCCGGPDQPDTIIL